MPIAPTYPGVYVEELPSGVHTIRGVSTSVTAFVGFFRRGPMNKAVQIFSVADLERTFGELDSRSEAGYAVRQFFANGGGEAWVVRVAGSTLSGSPPTPVPATAAATQLRATADTAATSILEVSASSPGAWGNQVAVSVDYDTTNPLTLFNLRAAEVDSSGNEVGTPETFRNLTMDSSSAQYTVDLVNDNSKLVVLEAINSPSATDRPAANGTVSTSITSMPALADGQTLEILTDPGAAALGTFVLGTPLPVTAAQLASVLQAGIRSNAPDDFPKATVTVVGSASTSQFLVVRAGGGAPAGTVYLAGTLATLLGLDNLTRTNVARYALGTATDSGGQAPSGAGGQAGTDGDLPGATELKGNLLAKSGLYALEDVDIFNILCLPDLNRLDDTSASSVIGDAEVYCEERRAFFVVDVPQDPVRDEVPEIKAWLDTNATLRHRNAAIYFPRPLIADPLNGFRAKPRPSSGTIAGLYARTDAERGVWKAPAGAQAALRGVQSLEYKLTDPENGTLNPSAINCLRSFPVYGNVCWGARTLVGDDQIGSEWKYIPVRRTALFIEESLFRGTKWAVFEPNDEPLWSQIRLNVGAFMHDLFRQGAFQGQKPQDAYFVKCDKDTTTQSDINRGVVNILVGFAPLKPAEFVIIQLQQIAGQIAT